MQIRLRNMIGEAVKRLFANHLFIIGLLAAVAVISLLFVPDLSALTALDGANAAHGDGQPADLFGTTSIFTKIVNILLFLIGAVSVIMIILGGLRYVVSGGNTSSITAAKNTILYAIIGLVIALLAYAIVNFVLSSLLGSGDVGGNGIGATNQ